MMLSAKLDEISEDKRQQGNAVLFFKQKIVPLKLYNYALCYAESKEKRALAYANRSVSYFNMRKYEECLMNIQWARENQYPAEKIQKLNEREEKCKKSLEEEVKDPADDPTEVFKLSYPANPKIPFIVDCVEQRIIDNKPRLYATRDLKPGDIIYAQELVFPRLYKDMEAYRCCYCLNPSMMNLYPCEKSASLMYCSIECRDKVYEIHGDDLDGMLADFESLELNTDRTIREIQHAFGGRDELMKFLKEKDIRKLKQKTLFDIDWREDIEKKKMIYCISLSHMGDEAFPHKMTAPSFTVTQGDFWLKILGIKMCKIMQRFNRQIHHRFDRSGKRERFLSYNAGLGICFFTSNLRNSCMPNVNSINIGNKLYYYTMQTVKAGEELFCYKYFYSFDEDAFKDRAYAIGNNNLKCYPDCYGCKHNIGQSNYKYHNQKETEEIVKKSRAAYNVKDIKEQMEENWKIIAKYAHDPLSRDAAEIEFLTFNLFLKLAHIATFPSFDI